MHCRSCVNESNYCTKKKGENTPGVKVVFSAPWVRRCNSALDQIWLVEKLLAIFIGWEQDLTAFHWLKMNCLSPNAGNVNLTQRVLRIIWGRCNSTQVKCNSAGKLPALRAPIGWENLDLILKWRWIVFYWFKMSSYCVPWGWYENFGMTPGL